MKIHNELCHTLKIINKIFGFIIITTSVSVLVNLTTQLYRIYWINFHFITITNEESTFILYTTFGNIIWIIPQFIDIVILCRICVLITIEVILLTNIL